MIANNCPADEVRFPPTAPTHRRCSSVSQPAKAFYHPDTIGEFNPMYSCSQPGDPCVVSGFGCMRYPLPGDAKIWSSCIASNKLNPAIGADGKPVPDTD